MSLRAKRTTLERLYHLYRSVYVANIVSGHVQTDVGELLQRTMPASANQKRDLVSAVSSALNLEMANICVII